MGKKSSEGKKGEFDAIFRQAVDSTEFKGAKTESAPLFLKFVRPNFHLNRCRQQTCSLTGSSG
jgi:hypothetical protein